MTELKHSSYYQKLLQLLGRLSDIVLFLTGFFLGKGDILVAGCLLLFRLISGYLTSDLVYKRLKASIAEGKS